MAEIRSAATAAIPRRYRWISGRDTDIRQTNCAHARRACVQSTGPAPGARPSDLVGLRMLDVGGNYDLVAHLGEPAFRGSPGEPLKISKAARRQLPNRIITQ